MRANGSNAVTLDEDIHIVIYATGIPDEKHSMADEQGHSSPRSVNTCTESLKLQNPAP